MSTLPSRKEGLEAPADDAKPDKANRAARISSSGTDGDGMDSDGMDPVARSEAARQARLSDPEPTASEPHAGLDGDEVAAEDVPAESAPAVPAPAARRLRASVLATLSLALSVAAVLFVLSGWLAGYGIALGGVAFALSLLGLRAAQRHHITGKVDAVVGLVLAAAAVALGILAVTGTFIWPTAAGDEAHRFREWLDTHLVDRL